MADELKLTVSYTYAKGNVKETVSSMTDSITVTNASFLHHVQNIGTSEEAIDLGDVAAGGYAMFRNLDGTNFISLRQATGASDMVRMDAGEFCLFRLDDDASAPFAIADTAACDMEVWLLDD